LWGPRRYVGALYINYMEQEGENAREIGKEASRSIFFGLRKFVAETIGMKEEELRSFTIGQMVINRIIKKECSENVLIEIKEKLLEATTKIEALPPKERLFLEDLKAAWMMLKGFEQGIDFQREINRERKKQN
jgi:hypothetical protein